MSADTMSSPPPPRRWGLRILLTLCGLLVLVWAAPMIAAWTPLVAWICGKASQQFNGSVRVGSASLGWFSPIRLYHVEILDADGQPIVHIAKIESDRSLLTLLVERDDLGSFRIDQAVVDWKFDWTTSNIEKALARPRRPSVDAHAAPEPAAWSVPQVRLEITNATLKVHDVQTQKTWTTKAITASALIRDDEGRIVQATLQGVTNDGAEAGALKAEMQLHHFGEPNAKASIKARFTSFPAPLVGLIARRYHAGAEFNGSLQGHFQLNADMRAGKPHVEIAGEVFGNHVFFASHALVDHLYVERLRAPVMMRLEDHKLIVQRAELESDFGKLTVQGTLDFDAEWRDALAQPAFDLDADLSLTTLAQRLPRTLHTHLDMQLLNGRLNVKCKSQEKDGDIVWQGHLHTSDVRGIKGQKLVTWIEPITLDFQVRNLHRGMPGIDHLNCSARFLRVEALQQEDQFTLRADADLRQFADSLGQLLDLGDLKLAGKINASLSVRRSERDFVMHGNAQGKDVNVSWLTSQPWQEKEVVAKWAARGQVDNAGRPRIDSADLAVDLDKDRIGMKLTEPIHDLDAGPWGTLGLRVEGDLTRWSQRVKSWTTRLDDWQFAGQADLHLQACPSRQAIEFTSAKLLATNCRCIGSSLWILEPTMNAEAAGRWDVNTGRVDLARLKLTSSAVRIDADHLSLQPATMALSGSADLVADVARLRQWSHDPRTNPAAPMAGTIVGRLDLQSSEERIAADFKVTLHNLIYGPVARPIWQEAEMRLVGRGVYDWATDVFDLERLNLATAVLGANGHGKIANISTTRDLDLAGVMTYDLEKLEPLLQPFLGKDVQIAGKESRTFRVLGPLYPRDASADIASSLSFRDLKGEAGLHWKSLKAHGCEVGPAQMKAVLQQGWLQFYPVETTLNGGKLRLQPNLKLEPVPMELILLSGPLIEKAKLTPPMCAGALGHAIPVMANVAQAEGSISLTLEGGRLPLSAPTEGELKGTLVLHHAKVGPNAIVREVSALLQITPPTGVVKECRVPFHLLQGKIHHTNLELTVGEFAMKSSGAVGLDGSLAIVVETPIPAQLAAAARLTPAQAKQILRIPIGGTLDHPRIDPHVLESLTSALGRSLLESELNKVLPKR